MKSFQITSSDLSFLADQLNLPIIRVVRYLVDGTAIYGYTVPASGYTDPLSGATITKDPFNGSTLPAAGSIVELGIIATSTTPIGPSGQYTASETVGGITKTYTTFDVFNTAWSLFLPPVVTATGKTTAGVGEPFGLRNVQGLFNNISLPSSATWGASFYPFARSSNADYGHYLQQRPGHAAINRPDFIVGVDVTSSAASATPFSTTELWTGLTDAQKAIAQGNSNYRLVVDPVAGVINLSDRYANPYLSIYDYTPRMISQIIDSQLALERIDAASLAADPVAGGYMTDALIYDLTNIYTGESTPVSERFQRNLNTLGGDPSLTGWNTLFGQFFDHGLDFIGKGGNKVNGVGSKIYIPLDANDPLFRAPNPQAGDPGNTKLYISRATVDNPQAAGADGMFGTADDIQSPGADGIYGLNVVSGLNDDIHGPTNANYVNHTSPYIDQSQTYGSDDSTTNLLREWVIDPRTGRFIPGARLFDGSSLQHAWTLLNPNGTYATHAKPGGGFNQDGTPNPAGDYARGTFQTLPTLNELRAYLSATGRDDLSWGDLDNLRVRDASGKVVDLDLNTSGIQAAYTEHTLIADLLPRIDPEHLFNAATIVALKAAPGFVDVLSGFDAAHLQRPSTSTDPEGSFISDYLNLASGKPTPFAGSAAGTAIVNEILLRSIGDHYVAGDGRANENFGLTAIHHVWHENHNWQLDNLLHVITQQQAADPTHTIAHAFQINTGLKDASGNYIYSTAGSEVAWDQEKLFQATTLINQGEYQHVAIDQYARGMSPNIPLFVQYDSGVNADVTLDYSQVAFRFGHSQLRETIDTLDPTGSLSGAITRYALEQAFLNPSGFAKTGPTAIALGMSRQFSNEIDEIVTPALQQNLLGQATDLAAINIARGRDLGMPSLNNLRRQLSFGLTAELNSLNQKLLATPGDVTLQQTIDKTIALQAGLQPYSSWADFGNNILHPEALVNFIAAYSFDGDLGMASVLLKLATGALYSSLSTEEQATVTTGLGWSFTDDSAYGITASRFVNGGDNGYEAIDAWNGGLAEKHVFLGELGSTFDAIFADQMTRLINGDRFYYFWRFQLGLPTFTELNSAIATEQFKDVIERTTGAQHLVGNVFFAADSYVELSESTPGASDAMAGAARHHKYGDLLTKGSRIDFNGQSTNLIDGQGVHLGVASIGGRSETLNGYLTQIITGQNAAGANVVENFILDVRPDTGANPDGTASAGFNSHEVLGGTTFRDYIDAGDGDDTIYGDDGPDILLGNAGADHIYGERGNDLIYGGELPDFLDGGIGDDEIHGGNDADVIIGGDGNDKLFGENGLDELHAGFGHDFLNGGKEADVLYGGEGQDIVVGDEGLDGLYGEWGDDRLYGGPGPDQLFGGYGDDILNAGFGGQNQNVNVDEALGDFGFNIVSFNDTPVPLNHSADLNQENVNLSNVTPFGQLWVKIQGVEGSQFADELIGYNGSGSVDATLAGNWLIGAGGNDKITTGSGDDVIVGDSIRLDALIGSYQKDANGNYLTDGNGASILASNGLLDDAYPASAGFGKHFLDLLKSTPDFTFGDTVSITANGLVYTHQAVSGNDTAIYAGARSNFLIGLIVDPSHASVGLGLKVQDRTGVESGANGDIVTGVETFTFATQAFSLAQLVAPAMTAISDDTGGSGTDAITKDNTLILSGTALAGSPVQIFKDGSLIGSTLANSSGQWSFDYQAIALADGTYNFAAKVTLENQVYASSPFSVKVDTLAPGIIITSIGGADGIVSSQVGDNTVQGTVGTADAGLTVSIKAGAVTLGTALADGNGNFSYSLTAANISTLAQGSGKSITVTAADTAGNLGTSAPKTFGIDTVAPAVSISSIGGADGIVSAQVGDATVLGTTEPGLTVAIKSGTTTLGTAVASVTGDFSYSLTAANITTLGQGAGKSITAAATDAAGNVGTSAARIFTIATVVPPAVPNAPVITRFNNVTGTTLTITGTTDAGSIVSLYNGSSTTPLTGTYTSSGNAWSFATTAVTSAITPTTFTITAKATNAAGASAASSATTVIAANSAASAAAANNNLAASGPSVVLGYGGNDSLTGSAGADTLLAGDGSDSLVGGAGADILVGGYGNDTLTGGAGGDQFIFASGNVANPTGFATSQLGVDVLVDFNASEGDKIVLSKAIFTALSSAVGANSLAASEIGLISATAAAELLTSNGAAIIYNQTTGHLIYNSNGSSLGLGGAGGVFATLGAVIHPTGAFAASNFSVVA